MRAIALAGLVIFTLGAYAYGALAVIWLRERRARRAGRATAQDVATGLLIAVSLLWFTGNALLLLLRFARVAPGEWPEVAMLCLAFAFPPIIVHIGWAERMTAGQPPARAWRVVIAALYGVAFAIPAWGIAAHTLGAPVHIARMANVAASVGLSALFIVAASCAIALGSRREAPVAPRERQARRWMAGLFGVTILLFVTLLGLTLYFDRSAIVVPGLVGIAAKSLPLVFFFVGTYYENRFEFFDLFVKRGASLVAIIAVLTAWFALVRPLLPRLGPAWAAPLVAAILVLPVAAALPWLSARLGAILDRRWLGRRFSTVEAVTHFLARTATATTEEQLVADARAALSHIFGAPAAIAIATRGPETFAAVQEIEIRSSETSIGRFVMGARAGDAPYFSQDVALLESLADLFSHRLENLRLQARELAQERRARELTLDASRSELKALRAQINPHFLFNALNSIAGLIHREPAAADRTIEQLADVFRYTLRRADHEWAVLDDELEFVRAYLEVERARFGPRLQVDVRLDAAARGLRIPTMIVQTLVENAVKHGVSSVRGPARLEIDAECDAAHLVVSVADNGPGFRDGAAPAPRPGEGYGLANVRQRLHGYFGDNASVEIRRDADAGVTTVAVRLPLVQGDPVAAAGAAVGAAPGRALERRASAGWQPIGAAADRQGEP